MEKQKEIEYNKYGFPTKLANTEKKPDEIRALELKVLNSGVPKEPAEASADYEV